MNRGMKASLTIILILACALPVVLAGCAGPEEKKSKPAAGLSESPDQPSGNKARDLYEEMLDEEQEDMERLDELLDD